MNVFYILYSIVLTFVGLILILHSCAEKADDPRITILEFVFGFLTIISGLHFAGLY